MKVIAFVGAVLAALLAFVSTDAALATLYGTAVGGTAAWVLDGLDV